MAQIRIGNRIIRIGNFSGVRFALKLFNLAPSVPTGLGTSNLDTTSLTFSWSASTDDVAVSGYEYRIDGGSPVDVGNVLTVNITGLTAGTGYSLQVRAYDGEGLRSDWSAVHPVSTTGGNQAPTTPTNLGTANVADTSMDLSWDASTDDVAVSGYEYRIDGGSPVDVGNVLTASITGLTAGTEYSLQVRAYDGEGLRSAYSTALLQFTTGSAPAVSVLVVYGDVSPDGYIPSSTSPDGGLQYPYHQMRIGDTGNEGISQLVTAWESMTDELGRVYVVSEAYDMDLDMSDDGNGNPVGLAGVDVLLLLSSQRVFTAPEIDRIVQKVENGMGLWGVNDSAWGGEYWRVGIQNTVGQSARNPLFERFGIQFGVDEGSGVKSGTIPAPELISGGTALQFNGEGVSPIRYDLTAGASKGNPRPLVLYGETPNHSTGITYTGPASCIVIATPGAGHVVADFDRNDKWNNGAGTNVNNLANLQKNKRLLMFAAGGINTAPDQVSRWDDFQATSDGDWYAFDAETTTLPDGYIDGNTIKAEFNASTTFIGLTYNGTRFKFESAVPEMGGIPGLLLYTPPGANNANFYERVAVPKDKDKDYTPAKEVAVRMDYFLIGAGAAKTGNVATDIRTHYPEPHVKRNGITTYLDQPGAGTNPTADGAGAEFVLLSTYDADTFDNNYPYGDKGDLYGLTLPGGHTTPDVNGLFEGPFNSSSDIYTKQRLGVAVGTYAHFVTDYNYQSQIFPCYPGTNIRIFVPPNEVIENKFLIRTNTVTGGVSNSDGHFYWWMRVPSINAGEWFLAAKLVNIDVTGDVEMLLANLGIGQYNGGNGAGYYLDNGATGNGLWYRKMQAFYKVAA